MSVPTPEPIGRTGKFGNPSAHVAPGVGRLLVGDARERVLVGVLVDLLLWLSGLLLLALALAAVHALSLCARGQQGDGQGNQNNAHGGIHRTRTSPPSGRRRHSRMPASWQFPVTANSPNRGESRPRPGEMISV